MSPWRSKRAVEALALGLLVVLQVGLALPALDYGVLADNDFVGHAATAMVLHHEHWPETGAWTGWNPRFNLGSPFLLYNPPPLLYVAAVGSARLGGLEVVLALKLLLIGGFAAVPATVWWLARECEDERTSFPILAAAAAILFSSELWGLEFFFRNGMANAAFAVPIAVAGLAAFRRALRLGADGGRSWALAAILFALVVLTHLTTAYMLAIGLGAFAVVHRAPGAGVIAALGVAVIGAALTAPWLVPSLALAAPEPAAFTWVRDPFGILSGVARGTWFSSYEAGFYPRFRSSSSIGAAVLVLAGYGALSAIRRRDRAPVGLVVMTLLAMWITLGPRAAGPLLALPLYDELLWYRFATLAMLGWLLLAGYGASRLLALEPPFAALHRIWRPVAAIGLVIVALAAGRVVLDRAGRIETAADFGRETLEIDEIADWLVANGDPRRRLFSEFPFQAPNAVSVNYTRHMLPVETGFDEVGGWIYEHNAASQILQARGPFWYDPYPMIRDATSYDAGYIVARSDGFKGALDRDPRWHRVVATDRYGLYRAVIASSRVDGPARTTGYREGHTRGGGYEIRFQPGRAGPHVVKTNASPFWTAEAGGNRLAVGANELGLLTVDVGAPDAVVHLLWTPPRRPLSWLATAFGAVVLLGAAVTRGDRLPRRRSEAAGGLAFAAVAVVCVLTATDRRVEDYAFGLRDGLVPTADPARIEVGAWDDRLGPNRLLGGWTPPLLLDGAPARLVLPGARAIGLVLASPRGATIHVEGRPLGDGSATLRVHGADGALLATGSTDRPLVVPPIRTAEDGPGTQLVLSLETTAPWAVAAIQVEAAVVYVEGEQLRNVLHDSGADAFIGPGPEGVIGHGGALTMLHATVGTETTIQRDLALEPGAWDVWIRLAPAYASSGNPALEVRVDDRRIGTVRPPVEVGLGWAHAGRVDIAGPSTVALGATADAPDWVNIDLIAFVRR